jgi:hypothetical protein
MKRVIIGLIPALMLASTVSFEQALNDAYTNNNELKAKKLNIEMGGIEKLEENGVRNSFIKAIKGAYEKSQKI